MTTPHIIRTAAELEALDPETLLIHGDGDEVFAGHAQGNKYYSFSYSYPAVVMATGEQVRAARKALEELS